MEKLATQHFQHFNELLNQMRPLLPNSKLTIGTACTGSGADVLTMNAIAAAAAADPDGKYGRFEFEYVFH